MQFLWRSTSLETLPESAWTRLKLNSIQEEGVCPRQLAVTSLTVGITLFRPSTVSMQSHQHTHVYDCQKDVDRACYFCTRIKHALTNCTKMAPFIQHLPLSIIREGHTLCGAGFPLASAALQVYISKK